jgi:hypothetical protein
VNHYFKNISILCLLISLSGTLPVNAKTLDFSLFDSYGRKVTSQDYKGVPVFLEFGACW